MECLPYIPILHFSFPLVRVEIVEMVISNCKDQRSSDFCGFIIYSQVPD